MCPMLHSVQPRAGQELQGPPQCCSAYVSGEPAFGSSLIAQSGKSLPPMQETWVQSLGQEDPLEKKNGNPFQYSRVGNPMDRGAWRAIVPGVANSQTQLSD